MSWEFPTSTCEVPVEGMPRQPWSSLANALIIAMLLTRKRTKLVGSIILFELVHLAAHVTYSKKLSLLQHLCIYPILHYYARAGRWSRVAMVVDLIVVMLVGGFYQVASGFVLFYSHTIPDMRVKVGGGRYCCCSPMRSCPARTCWSLTACRTTSHRKYWAATCFIA